MRKKADHETSIWISMTDLMSGLLVLFLFISISMTLSLSEKTDQINEITNKSNLVKQDLSENISNNFSESELQKYNLNRTDGNSNVGDAHFNDESFNPNESELPPPLKDELKNFLPKYIKAAYDTEQKNPGSIQEIRIEGHTSSEWKNLDGTQNENAYIINMELSQRRAREMVAYALDSNEMPELKMYRDFMIKKLTANGLSSSRPIYKKDAPTVEDKQSSRRIEFKIVTNDSKSLDEIKAITNNQ